jgi:glutathionylspermidine synthase
LKPVYGRYSIDVFIGALLTEEEWIQAIKYITESEKVFIIQEFCEISSSDTYYTLDGNFVFPTKAFANIGCFILRHKFSGSCVRWSEDYLTTDDHTWITPIGIKTDAIKANRISTANAERKRLWNKVTERAMFEADFTGRFAKNFEYIGLDYLTLDNEKYKELEKATGALAALMHKTQELIYNNLEAFSEILGINSLIDLIKHRFTEEFLFLGRMDWALDASGDLKLLEINSETPAGLCESLFIDSIIKEELKLNLDSSNNNFRRKLLEQFNKIVKEFEKSRVIKTIGILASTYYEDWYTAQALYKVVKDLPYEFISGSIYDVKVSEGGKLSLFGRELDAVYRYYPLDWFDEEDMGDKKEALKNTLSINPAHTIISQSKAFFAVIYELLKQGYYSEEESALIKKYIPRTAFEVQELQTYDYIVKPLLSREGHGVALACELQEQPDDNNIYQERVQTLSLDYIVHSNIKSSIDNLYPIIGTYVTGTEFAGIYTRLGKFVTDNICIYAPVFINK